MSMEHNTPRTTAIETLESLGLKQYEAECFTALTRLSYGTAKEISDATDVPRTRVYDAVEQLQREGLVDIQHSSPQQFRAISVTEATALLRQRFNARLTRLQTSLDALEPIEPQTNDTHASVWTTTGSETITRRMVDFLDRANEEAILFMSGNTAITDQLLERVQAAADRGVAIYVGTLSEAVHERLATALPDVTLFASELEWLQPRSTEDETIGRLLLVDRETLLVSSIGRHTPTEEAALWSDGVGNGLLVILRRLLTTGLDSDIGPQEEEVK
ncbi:TrmB family transcriptional regulator [Halocatena marina]|uniref:TrmB family transcriptional regulator n=1 Tax=Halocatena marina TaxID=2934937 RepID=A0ABD5YPA1_9EURY|nr:helix-turn-helix domain-containing protein [Halocatena marina]